MLNRSGVLETVHHLVEKAKMIIAVPLSKDPKFDVNLSANCMNIIYAQLHTGLC